MAFSIDLKDKKAIFSIATFSIITAILIFVLSKGYKDIQDSKVKPELSDQKEAVEKKDNLNALDAVPKDFPIYKNASVSGSTISSGSEGSGISIVWETSDDPEKVHSFYSEELSENGWKIVNDQQDENFYSLSFEKGSSGGFLGITRSLKKTILSVTIRKS